MAKVTASDRKKTGIEGSGQGGDKKFPVNSLAQAKSAIKMRHNGKGVSAAKVLAHVASSPFASNPSVKAAMKKAHKADKKK